MTFEDAVTATSGLEHAYRPGLRALRGRDRQRIRCENPTKLAGSVDLDGALADSLPNDPRWDYGIAVRGRGKHDFVNWVEVHPASSSHIDDVLSKLAWLKQWLDSSAPSLDKLPRKYLWLASGRVAIGRGSPQRKRLASQGIRLVGQRLRL